MMIKNDIYNLCIPIRDLNHVTRQFDLSQRTFKDIGDIIHPYGLAILIDPNKNIPSQISTLVSI
jgi:hypothetical protein